MAYVICSKSNVKYEDRVHKLFSGMEDIIVGIGGGSSIDKAKIHAGDRRCIAIPTTASGAAMTSHAVIWEENKKVDIKTRLPIMLPLYELWDIKLPEKVLDDTFTDCLCHCFEALLNEELNKDCVCFASLGFRHLELFLASGDVRHLINAGNWGGRAIEISPTNIIHKPSYEYTLQGISHGQALKRVLKEKEFSECYTRESLYTDIVQLPRIASILGT